MRIRGHAGAILPYIQAYEERKVWEDQLHSEFPKLLSGFMASESVGARSKEEDWQRKMDLDNHIPVSGRFFTFPESHSPTDIKSHKRLATLQEATKNDLWDLGCNVRPYTHNRNHSLVPEDGEPDIYKSAPVQYCLFLPHMKPSAQQGEETVRDIDGAATFLAYLLHKGWVTEQEVINADEHTNYNTDPKLAWPAFGKSILTLAKSPDIQAKIRSLDGTMPDAIAR